MKKKKLTLKNQKKFISPMIIIKLVFLIFTLLLYLHQYTKTKNQTIEF